MPNRHTPYLPSLFSQPLVRLMDTLASALSRRRAEAELRALDEHELRDLGLDRGGIVHAARHGRAAW